MNGTFRPIIVDSIKHIYKLFTNSNYRNYNQLYSRLKKYPRFEVCKVKVDRHNLTIPDAASFLSAYKEIFLAQIYKFKVDTASPKILDLGANIGLSVLFFKDLYPEAEIIALEADPKIYQYLEQNVSNRGYQQVKLINKAVWHENTTLSFFSEGADSGQINTCLVDDINNINNIEVEAIDISELLENHQFDFIKMDIEGAESLVIPRCKGLLDSVQYFFVEYHSKVGEKQDIDKILNLLSQEGFRVYMENLNQKPTPFLGLSSYQGYDFQINIYAWKE